MASACSTRLFVVSGNLQCLTSMLDKHPSRSQTLVVTLGDCSTINLEETTECVANLQERGVTVLDSEGLETLQMSEHPSLRDVHFRKMHYSCPPMSDSQQKAIAGKVALFFQTAARIQKTGDRLYLSLPQPQGQGERYQALYGLQQAADQTDYLLYAIRPIDSERYPGFKPAEEAQPLGEFVFVKDQWPDPKRKRSIIQGNDLGTYYRRDIDLESSGPSDTEEESNC